MANPIPEVPSLVVDGNYVDLDLVGTGTLTTYIKYPNMLLGDLISPNWRGCGAAGEVNDYGSTGLQIGDSDLITGKKVEIPYEQFNGMDQGWAFYSYGSVIKGVVQPESARRFMYLGKRPTEIDSPALPVAQIEASHHLELAPEAEVVIVIAPYLAMAEGDKVVITWKGFDAEGNADNIYSETKTIKPTDIDKPLVWNSDIRPEFIDNGTADVSYSIDYVSGGRTESASQIFTIKTPTHALLSEAIINNFPDLSVPLDPRQHSDGITVQLAVYDDIAIGDEVLLYWSAGRQANSFIKALSVDFSIVDSGILEFKIPYETLVANDGQILTIAYQYARVGHAQSSRPIILTIKSTQALPLPIIENVVPDGADDKGILEASKAKDGAYVRIPDSVLVGTGELVEVHWLGHANGGNIIVKAPTQDPKRFLIPGSAVAPNMGDETKRFNVFYRITRAGGVYQDSAIYSLRIKPIPQNEYNVIQCIEAQGKDLSVSGLNNGPAHLELRAWTFFGSGQPVTITVSGLDRNNNVIELPVRRAVPVSASEYNFKLIKTEIPFSFLSKLRIISSITISVSVSFDLNLSQMSFPRLSVTLAS